MERRPFFAKRSCVAFGPAHDGNFGGFVSLSQKIQNDAFVSDLRIEAKFTNAQIQRRAEFTLDHVVQ